MRPKIDYILKYNNNKFGTTKKCCGVGEFHLSKIQGTVYIHIYYEDKEVLMFTCYKNPYFIAKGILNKSVVENISIIREYLNQGMVAGLDFTITDKGIKLRKA